MYPARKMVDLIQVHGEIIQIIIRYQIRTIIIIITITITITIITNHVVVINDPDRILRIIINDNKHRIIQ
jgi:hypothetical protein